MENELIKILAALELLKNPHSLCCTMTLIVPPGGWEVEVIRLPGHEKRDGLLAADFIWKAENNYGYGIYDGDEYRTPTDAWNAAIKRIGAYTMETMTILTTPALVVDEVSQNAA
jgi:hypothetical protein